MSEGPDDDGKDLPPLIEQLRSAVDKPRRRHAPLGARLRSYFLTGLVIAAPISITVYVTWWSTLR